MSVRVRVRVCVRVCVFVCVCMQKLIIPRSIQLGMCLPYVSYKNCLRRNFPIHQAAEIFCDELFEVVQSLE